jgi:hypothetical protein
MAENAKQSFMNGFLFRLRISINGLDPYRYSSSIVGLLSKNGTRHKHVRMPLVKNCLLSPLTRGQDSSNITYFCLCSFGKVCHYEL